jgi:hypothetical protein
MADLFTLGNDGQLIDTSLSDPFTRAYNARMNAVTRAATARRNPEAAQAERKVYNPADEILRAAEISQETPSAIVANPNVSISEDDIYKPTGILEDIALIPERLRVGAQNLGEGRLKVLQEMHGAENVSPYGDGNFLIREPSGRTRIYNVEAPVPTFSDIASIVPEIYGSLAGAWGGAAGGAAGSAVPVVGTIAGAGAGGAAAYTAGKNATGQGISAFFGDDNPTSLEQIGWDALDGSTEALGPLIRVAAPGVKSLLRSSTAPVESAASALARSSTPTEKLAEITGNSIFTGASNNAANFGRDLIIGAEPTLASIAGSGGRNMLGRMAGMSDAVAEANDLYAANVAKYADDFLAGADDTLGATAKNMYAATDPTALADTAPIRDVLKAKASGTNNFVDRVRAGAGLAKESVDLFDNIVQTRPTTAVPTGASRATQAQQELLDTLSGTYDDVTKGDLTDIYVKNKYIPGLTGPDLELQDAMRTGFQKAIPEVAVADALAAPYYSALNPRAARPADWADELINAQTNAAARAQAGNIAFDASVDPIANLRQFINQEAGRVAVKDANELTRKIAGRTAGPGSLMARAATAAFHPIMGTATLGASIAAPRMLGTAMRSGKGVARTVRAAENAALKRRAAATSRSGLSSLVGGRAFNPDFRAASALENAAQTNRAAEWARMFPGTPNPFGGSEIALPEMGALGARSIQDYIDGLQRAYLSEALGRTTGKMIAEDEKNEIRAKHGAF